MSNWQRSISAAWEKTCWCKGVAGLILIVSSQWRIMTQRLHTTDWHELWKLHHKLHTCHTCDWLNSEHYTIETTHVFVCTHVMHGSYKIKHDMCAVYDVMLSGCAHHISCCFLEFILSCKNLGCSVCCTEFVVDQWINFCDDKLVL